MSTYMYDIGRMVAQTVTKVFDATAGKILDLESIGNVCRALDLFQR